jgi:D-glycero-D-manno-heptose 1,7-bisphosphate phosphatase
MSRKTIFLDRDGTIHETNDEWWRIDRFVFTDGAVEALRSLKEAGYALAVVTNQAGAARGLYTEADIEALHAHMQRLLGESGVALDAIVFCAHARDAGCACRKPATGMASQVEAAIGPVEYGESWMIGDAPSDMEFGVALDMRTALIRSAYWETLPEPHTTLVVDSLADAARRILAS